MDGKQTPPLDSSDFARQLRKIASDLWGKGGSIPEPTNAGQEKSDTPRTTPGQGKAAVPKPKKPELTIHNLWKTADETIDWTDALAHTNASDGLTSPVLWRFYHEKAEAVLAGNIKAYAEVLSKANPLGEMTRFADQITMKPVSADRVEVRYQTRENLMAEKEIYTAAVCLRMARDLFACLPVNEVNITALAGETPVMTVTYRRDQLYKRNFSFLDPIAFAKECGAQWPETD